MESLLPNTDNFFKYLLSIGIVLILFAVVYPLKKQQQLKIDAIQIKYQHEQLQNDINKLNSQYSEVVELYSNTQQEINKINKSKSTLSKAEIIEAESRQIALKETVDKKKDNVLSVAYQLKDKNLSLNYEDIKHSEIQQQIWDYAILKTIFLIVGMMMVLFGFIFWTGTAYMDDLIKGGTNVSLAPYKTSYVRCVEFVIARRIFFTTLLIALFFIAIFIYNKYSN